MGPLISIVIPVFNSAGYIAETIESAVRQTYPNKEIIVVDDGSTDASFEIASKYSTYGVTVVRQANKGASSARNHGILLSKGEFIQFLDADDLLHAKKIESQIRTLQNYTNLHLIGAIWRRFDRDVSKPYLPMPYREKETRHYNNIVWLINRPYMIPHTWLVSKKLIELAGLWDENLSFNDDGEFFYRIIASSAGVIIDHQAICFYRTGNSSSLSNRKDRSAMLSWIESIRSYKKVLHTLAGAQGNESVDRFFFELSYNCIDKFPDLYKVCRLEMYNSKQEYNLSDNLVFNLAKVVGLKKAKKARIYINAVRETRFVNYLIYKTKELIGWRSY
ncbi:MAG: hypothetical protein JWP67_2819 [Mucilaginibacter sp.]|nr:hypothetical protein [Mucilaginibacter sp.]